MKLAIMQPYFLPYIGYFQLINAVDKHVIYDDVNFIKKGWVNRNNILLNGKSFLINLLLSGASQNKLINQIDVQIDQKKLIKTIETAYIKAPMFSKVFPVFLSIMDYENRELGQFLGNSIIKLCNYMSINTELIFSSSIPKDISLKSQEKILHICKLFDADQYINAIGGQTLYDKMEFKKHNIALQFIEPLYTPYPQFKNEFIPYLSILDVLMFNPVEEVRKMLNQYKIL